MFIVFSKPAGKYLCKKRKDSVQKSHFDRVAQVTFTLAFYKLFQAAALQKNTLAGVTVNFETFLRFLTEHPKANTFVPFRSL